MEDQSIRTLEEQIAKLDEKNFDLEAWKSTTIALLSRIFDSDDPRIRRIENLKVDYGSWALRDASSSYNPVRSCKNIGREILATSLSELKTFGSKPKDESHLFQALLEILEEELKISQLKAIRAIIDSDKSTEEKKKNILKILNALGKGITASMLAELLMRADISENQ